MPAKAREHVVFHIMGVVSFRVGCVRLIVHGVCHGFRYGTRAAEVARRRGWSYAGCVVSVEWEVGYETASADMAADRWNVRRNAVVARHTELRVASRRR